MLEKGTAMCFRPAAAVSKCPECGALHDPDAATCPECGATLPQRMTPPAMPAAPGAPAAPKAPGAPQAPGAPKE